MIAMHRISINLCHLFLLYPAVVRSFDRPHSAWDAFNVEKIDDHLAHEHTLSALMFGMTISPFDAYFEAHDTDHNSKLDGLELLHALHHQNTRVDTTSQQNITSSRIR